MPRLQSISKYWVSWRSAAAGSSKLWRIETPCSGSCMTPLTIVGNGNRAASSTVGATSMT
jgi:hypothetical protein